MTRASEITAEPIHAFAAGQPRGRLIVCASQHEARTSTTRAAPSLFVLPREAPRTAHSAGPSSKIQCCVPPQRFHAVARPPARNGEIPCLQAPSATASMVRARPARRRSGPGRPSSGARCGGLRQGVLSEGQCAVPRAPVAAHLIASDLDLGPHLLARRQTIHPARVAKAGGGRCAP